MFRRELLLFLVLGVPALRAETIKDLGVLYTPLTQELAFVLTELGSTRTIVVEAIADESHPARHLGKFYRWDETIVFQMKNVGAWILGEIQSELSAKHPIRDPVLGSVVQQFSRIRWGRSKPALVESSPGVFQLSFSHQDMLALEHARCDFNLAKPAP